MKFASFFRQWVSVCTVASPVQGTYFLQVQTAKKIDGTATPNGGGSNRFSIRVGIGANFATTNGVHVYGNQKMGAYANATGANTQFFLTRVLPGEAGKTLVLNFYDTGDASQPGTLAVLPPADSNVTGGVFAGCLFTLPPGNATGPPWGTFSATALGLQDHQRRERHDAELQRPVGHLGDPDPEQLHVRHRVERDRLLDEAPVRLSGRNERDRHHHLVGVHPRRAGSNHPVGPRRDAMASCPGVTPVIASCRRPRCASTARARRAVGWSIRVTPMPEPPPADATDDGRRARAAPVAPEAVGVRAGGVPRISRLPGHRVGVRKSLSFGRFALGGTRVFGVLSGACSGTTGSARVGDQVAAVGSGHGRTDPRGPARPVRSECSSWRISRSG